jgi:hypothetical protein
VILKKNLSNENLSPNAIGSGLVVLSGTQIQTINGQNIIQNLTVNNTAGVNNGGETRTNGVLMLSNGTISLGGNNLLLGPAATIAGTPSAAIMIIATGSGQLRKEFAVGYSGSFVFPVGDDTNVPEYSPVTLNFTSASFGAGNYVGVNLVNAKYPDPGIIGNYLNRFWTITQSAVTNFNCNATFQYTGADVAGDENVLSCARLNPAPWTTYNLSNPFTHQLLANGLVIFGTFTGVKSTTPPANQQLENITLANGVSTCYDATQELTLAGNGTTFLVENGGDVTLVAGYKIHLLPGTKVISGGTLHGYITTTNTYCNSNFNPLVANNDNSGEALEVESLVKNKFIKIYPNPTTDIVIVELADFDPATSINITVYTICGEKLLQKTIRGDSRFRFSLTGKSEGLYMVQVQSGERSEIAKVIKTN